MKLPPHFIGIKWKAIVTLTLLLLGINGVFTWWNDRQLRSQYGHDRALAHERQEQTVSLLLAQNLHHLERIAGTFGIMEALRVAAADRDMGKVEAAIKPFWGHLNIDQGIETLTVISSQGIVLSSLGEPGDLTQTSMALGNRSLDTEQPQRGVYCAKRCQNFVAMPVLSSGKTVGSVVVSSTLADTLGTFRKITGANLGYGLAAKTAPLNGPSLPLEIHGLTGGSESRGVIRQVADDADEGRGNGTGEVQMNGRHFETHYFRPSDVPSSERIRFVVVNDVTHDKQAIDGAMNRNFVLGSAGLLTSEILVLAFLWWPIRRLNAVTREIPALGQGKFERVRNNLERLGFPRFPDEFDVLERAAVELADRLEYLQEESDRHQEELQKLINQLSRERDFSAGLLDTAQVLILTQDKNGRILMANGLAQKLTGLRHNYLVGRLFLQNMALPDQASVVEQELELLWRRQQDVVQIETSLPCLDGTLRDIIWFHSLIGNGEESGGVVLSVGMDVTELQHARQKMSFLAESDALTGLPNREKFQETLSEIFAGTGEKPRGALIVFDLDEFKAVNELGGQSAGDRLLVLAASKLRELHPEPACIGRLGSDDFAAFFADMQPAQAIQMARKINAGFRAESDPKETHELSACSGLAMFPQHGKDAQDLLSHANLALNQAKTKGRGSWHVYSPEEQMKERVLGKAQTLSLIEQALAQDGFELHFQPIVAVADGSCEHYEALVRIRDESGALVPPGLFIPVAEQTGQIRQIDYWVIRRAIRILSEERESISLAVNLSARSLVDRSLAEEISAALKELRVDADRLILEITETTALAEMDTAVDLLSNLRNLGCRIALDDFGVGFSSFQYLKQLPVDVVKIDGSFIRGLDKNEDDRVFVRALNEAVHGYGKQTIAEFVENAAILRLLRDYGVDYAQGYHIGKPEPVLYYPAAA